MNKIILCVCLLIQTILLFGCFSDGVDTNEVYQTVNVESTIHDNSFEYSLTHKRGHYEPSRTLVRIEREKQQFFEELKQNEYYIEEYDENTLVFYKENGVDSAYFIVQYTGINHELYAYDFKSVSVNTSTDEFDFPCYVLESEIVILSVNQEYGITCEFAYLKNYYQRLGYIFSENEDNYFTVATLCRCDGQNIQTKTIRFDKIDEDSFRFSMIV